MTATSIDLAAVFPDEVVTNAFVRFVELAGLPGRVALITLDNGRDYNRPNTLGPRSLDALEAAIDEATAARPAAIAVTGKPFGFAAGADLSGIGLPDRETAAAIVHRGQRVLRRFHDSQIPTFAFVNGLALGGALELALHCHYRTLAANCPAIGFPEVFLGILPGWGGTQLLPRMAGPETAVTVIVDNALNQSKTLKPAEALKLGVVDVVLDAADYLEESLRWLGRVVAGSLTVLRPTATDSEWQDALDRGRVIADLRTKGAPPAPYRALEMIALAKDTEFDAGLAAEAAALTELLCTQEFRASLYAFNLTRKRARHPVGVPDAAARPVHKVGVLGAGLMAGQLAMLFARYLEVPVVITDVDQSRLDRGLTGIHKEIDGLKRKGKISADKANRQKGLISGTLDLADYADADLVIEAVFEELSVKQDVFARLEKHIRPDCVLATNTSALSVSAMAAHLEHPERVVGFHFFNPVALMPLVEIARTGHTDDVTLATAFAVAKQLRKTPILVADRTAFVVNRLLLRMMGEVLVTIDEGTPADVADHALDPLGLPMTTMMLLQLVGPAVALHVAERLNETFPERFPLSPNLVRLVAGNHTTLVTWNDQGQQIVDPAVLAGWEQGDSPSTAQQVLERALDAVAIEARLMLAEGVVPDPADIDLAMLTGAGFPFWLGGITPYLDRSGASERATQRRFAAPGVATLPA